VPANCEGMEPGEGHGDEPVMGNEPGSPEPSWPMGNRAPPRRRTNRRAKATARPRQVLECPLHAQNRCRGSFLNLPVRPREADSPAISGTPPPGLRPPIRSTTLTSVAWPSRLHPAATLEIETQER